MGVPTPEVGYTAAMPRREDNEVHKDMWWHWTKKKQWRDDGLYSDIESGCQVNDQNGMCFI